MNKQFIQYLQQKGYATETQKICIHYVKQFLKWYMGDMLNCGVKDILAYLQYLQQKGLQNSTRQKALASLRNYFDFLYQHSLIVTNPVSSIKIQATNKKYLYKIIYTPDQLSELYQNYYHVYIKESLYPGKLIQQQRSYFSMQRNYAVLGFLLFQGLVTSQVQNISLSDIDFIRATVYIKGTKNSNPRSLPLNAQQTGSLIHYIENIRPYFLQHTTHTDNLFICLPAINTKTTRKENLSSIFMVLTKQVLNIDKDFIRFQQLRASVITHWIKTYGLRKAQYLAGHKHINSTEKFIANDLTALMEDITRFNPF